MSSTLQITFVSDPPVKPPLRAHVPPAPAPGHHHVPEQATDHLQQVNRAHNHLFYYPQSLTMLPAACLMLPRPCRGMDSGAVTADGLPVLYKCTEPLREMESCMLVREPTITQNDNHITSLGLYNCCSSVQPF